MIIKLKTFSGEVLYLPEEDYLEEVMYSSAATRAAHKMSKTLGQITVGGRSNNGRYMDYLNKYRYGPDASKNLKHLEDMVVNRKQMGDKWAHYGNPMRENLQVLREQSRNMSPTYGSTRGKLMRMREKNLKKIGETAESLEAKYKGASTEAGLRNYREIGRLLK